jgi:hypothetical protein
MSHEMMSQQQHQQHQQMKMNSLEKKIAIMDVMNAKEKVSLAQAAHDVEVKTLKECEKALLDGFHAKVSLERFDQLRESKRIQARVVRESFRTLVEALNALDDAESNYDVVCFSTMESMK